MSNDNCDYKVHKNYNHSKSDIKYKLITFAHKFTKFRMFNRYYKHFLLHLYFVSRFHYSSNNIYNNK